MKLEDLSPEAALAALHWQLSLGADEAISAVPLDRLKAPSPEGVPLSEAPNIQAQKRPAASTGPAGPRGPVQDAIRIAASAQTLDALRAGLAAFEGCALKQGARNLVFADGLAGAHVMVIGEAPGQEEDRMGLPFVGASGRLLDAMFAAIGLSRTAADPASGLYITNTLPWRPPRNRTPSDDEVQMMLPFLERHIALAAPSVIVPMGSPAVKAVLATATGITRLRGRWAERQGVRVLPMFHPAALLRDPMKKRETWADLLSLKAGLKS